MPHVDSRSTEKTAHDVCRFKGRADLLLYVDSSVADTCLTDTAVNECEAHFPPPVAHRLLLRLSARATAKE